MKNLMNRVLVVLAVSAVFAGSIDASQAKRGRRTPVTKKMAKPEVSRAKMALNYLRSTSKSNFKVHTVERRKAQANILREEVPGASAQIAILEKAALTKDDAQRKESLTGGAGAKAAAAIELAMLNDDLKDANADLKDNPTPANVEKVAIKQAEATAAVAQLDETAEGYKGYMTAKNALLATIGIAAVAVTGYCIANGAPTWLAPYVPPFATDIANRIYSATSATGEFLGMQEGGKVYEFGKKVGEYMPDIRKHLPSKETVMRYAPSLEGAKASWIAQKLGFMTGAQKEAFAEQQAINAQINAEKATEEAEAALNALQSK